MAKRGRPPKLDETKRGEILGVLAWGGTMALAARTVGCCTRTIYNTAKRDPEFDKRMQRARASHELKLLKRIDDAASDPKYWRAAAWQLERMYPDRYQPRMARSMPVDKVEELMHELMRIVRDILPDGPDRQRFTTQARDTYDRYTAEQDDVVEAALELNAAHQDLLPAGAA